LTINHFYFLLSNDISGNEVRIASRHAAYWKKHGRKGPSSSASPMRSATSQTQPEDMVLSHIPGFSLPNDLIEQALLPLPKSAPLFQKALAGSDDLDESDLWRWKDGPPYVVESGSSSSDPNGSSSSAAERNFTERLVEVIFGVWLREQGKDDEVLKEQFLQEKKSAALEGLSIRVAAMVEEWKLLTAFLEDYIADAREITMAHTYLQWQAYKTYHLYYLHFL
jgi:hypothetical protein